MARKLNRLLSGIEKKYLIFNASSKRSEKCISRFAKKFWPQGYLKILGKEIFGELTTLTLLKNPNFNYQRLHFKMAKWIAQGSSSLNCCQANNNNNQFLLPVS